MRWNRNQDKRIVAVVAGYIRHDVYATVEKWFDEAGAGYERHIYPWNSEGYQLHVVSNQPIDMEHDLVDATFNGDDDTKWGVTTEYAERPENGIARFIGPNYGGEWYTVGGIHGYEHDSTSPDDDRYEC